ncbi:MAG: hypothetical protein L3K17_00675 [Thermoplasmata archaeon]|nr:hypothetical protein [Thermoplasmata archaeon]
MVYSGNPYASTTWFNPPLAPYLAEPFVALITLLSGPQSLLISVPAIAPVAVATGVDAAVFPTSAALLAWKLPLIASDFGVALLLLRVVRERSGPGSGEWVVAAWFLNPLVIWASSVHGEVDTLAVFFVLYAVVLSAHQRWMAAGLALGVAVFAKGYPLVFLPLFAAALMASIPTGSVPERGRLKNLGRWVIGLGVSVVPFLYILPQTAAALLAKAGSPTYGGISVLAVFNAASPRAAGVYATLTTTASDSMIAFGVLRSLAVIAVIGATVGVYVRLHGTAVSVADRTTALAVACLIGGVAIFVSDSAPQPENVVGLLPLLLVAAPLFSNRAVKTSFAVLTAAGIAMYWSFLTPFGMFYPLAWMLGAPTVSWVNHVAIAYVEVPGLRGAIWLISGLVGGSTVLYLGASASLRLFLRPAWQRLRRNWSGNGGA